MKILALTDIHGAYSIAEEIISAEPADVVLIGGDLTTVGTVKEAEDAIHRFQALCPRMYCIAGNMDLPAHDELFVRLGVSVNARAVQVDDIAFFGVSAAPVSPLHTPYEISEEEIARRIYLGWREIGTVRTRIFLPHAPPYGTKLDIVHAGFHVGSTAVRDFIEDHTPDVVICGHIHEARGIDTIAESRIVNCGPAFRGYYAAVEIKKEIKIMNCHRSPTHRKHL